MLFTNEPTARARAAVADVNQSVYWLDRRDRPAATPPLVGPHEADLLVIGGGFTGLWTALLAKQEFPEKSILLVDGGRVGDGASGRNGGFVSDSLTHGFANGHDRWPHQLSELLALGRSNLDDIERTVNELGIDCDFVRAGDITAAVTDHQLAGMRETVALMTSFGEDVELLDAQTIRTYVNSPEFLGGIVNKRGTALVDPARLAWGLRAACVAAGVRVYERSAVTQFKEVGNRVVAHTKRGAISARQVVLATNAYPSLLKRVGHYVIPVYDYVLMTEPLTAEQRSSIGWSGGEGLSDGGNQFHYFRPTADGRILWGGYDATYHHGNGFGPQYDNDSSAYLRLAEHFLQTFPQLEGIRFSHGWGGAIDTCTRFSAFWGSAHSGKTVYVAGFTGLGVGASRFAALTMLDLLMHRDTPRTRLDMVKTKPIPFPPEPLRSLGIAVTTRSLQRADRTGTRNLWLKALDRSGLGFDS